MIDENLHYELEIYQIGEAYAKERYDETILVLQKLEKELNRAIYRKDKNLKKNYQLELEEYNKAKIHWENVKEYMLDLLDGENPVVTTSDFWRPFNVSVNADWNVWRNTLGKEAPLLEVLRFFWNYPYWNNNFFFHFMQVKLLKDGNQYVVDDNNDLVAIIELGNYRNKYVEFSDFLEHEDDFLYF